jgi:hypothetical protein
LILEVIGVSVVVDAQKALDTEIPAPQRHSAGFKAAAGFTAKGLDNAGNGELALAGDGLVGALIILGPNVLVSAGMAEAAATTVAASSMADAATLAEYGLMFNTVARVGASSGGITKALAILCRNAVEDPPSGRVPIPAFPNKVVFPHPPPTPFTGNGRLGGNS